MNLLKRLLLAILLLGAVTIYVFASFNPQQPIHHELNNAGGVVLSALFISYWVFPGGRGFDDD